CCTGTLPGRKPLMRTLSFTLVRRSISLASMSEAGTVTLISRFRPELSVSVTCIIQPLLHESQAVRRSPPTCRSVVPGWLWCGWRDLNPHGLRHRILSPACLPIPPHPLRERQGSPKRGVLYHQPLGLSKRIRRQTRSFLRGVHGGRQRPSGGAGERVTPL